MSNLQQNRKLYKTNPTQLHTNKHLTPNQQRKFLLPHRTNQQKAYEKIGKIRKRLE